MSAIWEAENRYRIWFEIEAHATDAWRAGRGAAIGSQGAVGWWATNPKIDVPRSTRSRR
jgi:adenylosuccinate lyase